MDLIKIDNYISKDDNRASCSIIGQECYDILQELLEEEVETNDK